MRVFTSCCAQAELTAAGMAVHIQCYWGVSARPAHRIMLDDKTS